MEHCLSLLAVFGSRGISLYWKPSLALRPRPAGEDSGWQNLQLESNIIASSLMVTVMIVCFVEVLNSGLQNEVRRRAVDEDAVGGPDEKPAHLEQAVQHVQAQVGEDLGEQRQPSMGSRIGNAGSFLRMRQGLMMLSIDAKKEEEPRSGSL